MPNSLDNLSIRLTKKLARGLERARQRRFIAGLPQRVQLGADVTVIRGTELGVVKIGTGTWIGNTGCTFKGLPGIEIGNYCDFGRGVHVVASNHAVSRANTQNAVQRRCGAPELVETRGPVTIGHNVWLGDNAVVLSGVTVGNGAVIGAGAVVTRDVDPFAIVAGIPARTIRKRFSDEVIEALEILAWWDWPIEQIEAAGALFEMDLTVTDDAAELLRIAQMPRHQAICELELRRAK